MQLARARTCVEQAPHSCFVLQGTQLARAGVRMHLSLREDNRF